MSDAMPLYPLWDLLRFDWVNQFSNDLFKVGCILQLDFKAEYRSQPHINLSWLPLFTYLVDYGLNILCLPYGKASYTGDTLVVIRFY